MIEFLVPFLWDALMATMTGNCERTHCLDARFEEDGLHWHIWAPVNHQSFERFQDIARQWGMSDDDIMEAFMGANV